MRWVLLRGLTRESRHWGEFPQTLRAALPGAEVVCLDLPGNGRLHRARSPGSVEAMAAHCRAELLARGLAPPYHLLALSLGAMVALAWAASRPQELAACVLVNTSVRPYGPPHWRLRPAALRQLLGLLLGGAGALQWEQAIGRLTSRRADLAAALLPQWLAWRQECPVSRANALRQLWAAARLRAPPARPPVPLLFVASARDALVDSRCSRRIATAWQADLIEHPTAGHDLPLDDGPWLAAQVRAWLDSSALP